MARTMRAYSVFCLNCMKNFGSTHVDVSRNDPNGKIPAISWWSLAFALKILQLGLCLDKFIAKSSQGTQGQCYKCFYKL